MATEITMPKLSDTMTEGRLISWKKSVGEEVERGEIIAEVETDKANMELEAFTSGVLLEIRVKPGETVPVGTVMALVGEAGEKGTAGPAKEQEKEEKKTEKAAESEGREKEEREETAVKAGDVVEGAAAAAVAPEAKAPAADEKSAPAGEHEKASPLVRRIAREQGIDLAKVQGSGPDGRILREDLERSTGDREPGTSKESSAESEGAAAEAAAPVQPLTRMRRAIARTVAEAWRTVPHFSVTVEVEMGEVERVRQELKSTGSPVSLNDFIVKAAATAIGKFPLINASFSADGITMHNDVNIGIAVALDDGLLVPVIRGCEALSLKETAARSRNLVKRAKDGSISEAEISGGTFSISNLGMFGVDEFTAVIHPPQGAILAVGAVMDRPVIKEGHLAAGRMMRVTISADHRLIDGAYAAKFLREMKRILENPVVMLV